MQPLPLAAVLMVMAPLTYLVWSFVGSGWAARRAIQRNLGLSKAGTRESGATLQESLHGLARKAMPTGYAAWLDRKIAGAGRPKAWPLEKVVVLKPLLALGGMGLGLIAMAVGPAPAMVLLTAGFMALGYFLPDLLLINTAQKRREGIQRALPNMLDQMLISVEAGVGFESAMSRAAQSGVGPLADEFTRTLQDIQVGRSRREAYLDLAKRADVADLNSFMRAVVQADQYGIAIANVMRTQASEMRLKRRQRAEEHAMKIPVKVLFPLVLFIFPSLFIIVLGPAALSIAKALFG
ncbi:type II secretion system F family protein [Sinomonas halotolerans]|uniref:Type II secretion system F family protein n=1 Tax=Sinomonas halotolerans TaxID=1644133 RepID=A0ABU9WYH3_9MICC